MAWYLREQSALFLHIPKCGGFWVEQALIGTGVPIQFIRHPDDPSSNDRHALIDHCPYAHYVFVVERDVCSWYESFWKYTANRTHSWDSRPWHPIYPLLQCKHADFNEFIMRCVKYQPGFLSRLYQRYETHGDGRRIAGLVKMNLHCIVTDMERALHSIGVRIDRSVLQAIPRQNRSKSACGEPSWIEDVKRQLLDAEAAQEARQVP